MTAKEIFIAVLRLPAEQRQSQLEELCGSDLALKDRVKGLLQAHEEIGSYLDDGQTRDMPPEKKASPLVGRIFAGKYKLLEEIGAGGMGAVFMADQLEPIRRRVAIKLIRPGMDTQNVLARFEAERQALALMDHPNIARILDAGTTEDGAPFFVMELVKGIPVTEYCDQHHLSIPQRLQLFQTICSAVQHAHQKGIIHRDLKPGNILVESHDGHPLAKVIDFGLAKALGGVGLIDNPAFTAFGSVTGTPLYMAPEQANFNAIDVDTRADIYALGVVLYELLTGTTPIERETLRKAAFDEVMRTIRETDPPRPSARVSSTEALPSIAASLHAQPTRLPRLYRGDLDWIVMKALSKERQRRYETALAFSEDIQRYLGAEPVKAGPDSARYRLAKFLRRNRRLVGTGALVGILVLFGLVGTTVGMFQAIRAGALAQEQRMLAQEREAQAQRAAAQEAAAREAAQVAEKETAGLNQFLLDTIVGSRFQELVYQGKTRDLPLSEALEKASQRLDEVFKNQPRNEAKLRHYLGNGFLTLGKPDQALKQLTRSYELYRKAVGPSGREALDAQLTLARAYGAQGQCAKAIEVLDDHLKQIPAEKEWVFDRIEALQELADNHEVFGYWEKATACRRTIVSLFEQNPEVSDQKPSALYHLGRSLRTMGQPVEAEKPLRESLALYLKQPPPLDWFRFVVQGELGACLLELKRPQEALALLEPSYRELKSREGNDIRRRPFTDDGRSQEVLTRLIEALDTVGQKARADQYRKEKKAITSLDQWMDSLSSQVLSQWRRMGKKPKEK